MNETKVVILGQDCYINYKTVNDKICPQATGLAFSVDPNFKIPPSLKNIFKELEETVDGFSYKNGDLSRWVKEEKVLLLNASLTVEYKKSNSHSKHWQNLTDNIIKVFLIIVIMLFSIYGVILQNPKLKLLKKKNIL